MMIKILFYLMIIQYILILSLYLFKFFYLKIKFHEYLDKEFFNESIQKYKTIQNLRKIELKSVFVPLVGLFKLPANFIILLDELNSYKKTEYHWKTIKKDDLFKQTRKEFNRLQLRTNCLLIAKDLINKNIHPEVILSSTEFLLSTLKLIVVDDENTEKILKDTVKEYEDLLIEIKNSPNTVDVETLIYAKTFLSSIKDDVKNSNALFD